MTKSPYFDDACFNCGVVGGNHDCDCGDSRFPKCSKCRTAYDMVHEVTGEAMSCLCGEEAI